MGLLTSPTLIATGFVPRRMATSPTAQLPHCHALNLTLSALPVPLCFHLRRLQQFLRQLSSTGQHSGSASVGRDDGPCCRRVTSDFCGDWG